MDSTGQPVPTTVTHLLQRRADDGAIGLRFEERSWTWAEHVRLSRERAAWLHAVRDPDRPFHVGVLLENVPELSFLLGAAAFSGAVIVGLNPLRRGEALARDVTHADCQLLVTEGRHRPLLDGLDLEMPPAAVFDIDGDSWADALAPYREGPGRDAATPRPGADSSPWPGTDPYPAPPGGDGPRPPAAEEDRPPAADDLIMLIFTSGTDGDPKAVRCTHRKVVEPGLMLSERMGLGGADCAYITMPMFHSNARTTRV